MQYPQTVSRTITRYPTLGFSVGDDGTITVTSDAPGRADVTNHASTASARLVAKESFTIAGSLTIGDGGRVTFVPG